MSKPKIMFYHDGRHPLIYMYEPPMQKEEYQQGVDELLGTPVEAIMFCLGDGRTVLHDTKVGELWGHNVKKWNHLIFRRAHQNALGLIRRGCDPLALICERAHQYGKEVYPTLLVQQGEASAMRICAARIFALIIPRSKSVPAVIYPPIFPALPLLISSIVRCATNASH